MNTETKNKTLRNQLTITILLGVVGVIILPLLWFLFCSQADFFLDSTSDVGGKYGHYTQLVSLGLVYGVFCGTAGILALKFYRYKDKIVPSVYLIGIILFLVTCVLPYDLNREGTLANFPAEFAETAGNVHNVLARVCIGFLLLPLLYFQILLLWKNKPFAIVSLCTLVAVIALSAFLIAKHGTCSIAECILQSYLSIYIFVAYLVEKLRCRPRTT